MAFTIGSLFGLKGLLSEGLRFFAFEKIIGGFRDKATDKVAEVAKEKGSKWLGFDRTDEALLARLNQALEHLYGNDANWVNIADALVNLWRQLLALDHGRGKWHKRLRILITGMTVPDVKVMGRTHKSKKPVMVKGSQAKDSAGNDLWQEEWEDKVASFAYTKEDPRIMLLYFIGKMAADELAGSDPNKEELPTTIEHLMVNYLQDDPFFKMIGEQWRKIILWIEKQYVITAISARMWLSKKDILRIEAAARGSSLTPTQKSDLYKATIITKKELLFGEIQAMKEVAWYEPFLRRWWLFLFPAAILILIIVLQSL